MLGIFTAPALAACSNPNRPEGTIVYETNNNVPMYCNGADWIAFGALNPSAGGSGCASPARTEGAIVYNSSFHVLQYCDGDDWRAVGSSSLVDTTACIPPSLCPNIGDICDDGNAGTANDPIFAGFILRDAICYQLFVTDTNQSTGSQWKTTSGADDIIPDSNTDGWANHNNRLGNISDFPALEICENLTDGGFADWYLPSRNELHVLFENQAVIDANAVQNFAPNAYWSSTERNINNAFYQPLDNGKQLDNTKTTSTYYVRCVRSSGSTFGGNPTGCSTIGDLCSDGTIFAGDTNMYVADINQSTGIQWKTSIGTDDINPDSLTDGQANHTNRAGLLSDFPAFELCENLTRNSHTDWYLPAKDELNILYTNKAAIDANAQQTFAPFPYWSSSENTINNAWYQDMDNGNQVDNAKTTSTNYHVRCVRRN